MIPEIGGHDVAGHVIGTGEIAEVLVRSGALDVVVVDLIEGTQMAGMVMVVLEGGPLDLITILAMEVLVEETVDPVEDLTAAVVVVSRHHRHIDPGGEITHTLSSNLTSRPLNPSLISQNGGFGQRTLRMSLHHKGR